MRDILLHIDSYPEPTTPASIENAVGIAAALESRISALAIQVGLRTPGSPVVDFVIGLSDFAAVEEAKSAEACRSSLELFEDLASAQGVFAAAFKETADILSCGTRLAELARTRDLTIVPIGGPGDGQIDVARAVIFGSGRPVLVLPRRPVEGKRTEIGDVVLAWDGGRSAARSMSDALPILRRARSVVVLTVLHDKPSAVSGQTTDLLRHLHEYGIKARLEEIDGAGLPIGEVIERQAVRLGASLVVMGACFRQTALEVLLGGATGHMLQQSALPVLFSA